MGDSKTRTAMIEVTHIIPVVNENGTRQAIKVSEVTEDIVAFKTDHLKELKQENNEITNIDLIKREKMNAEENIIELLRRKYPDKGYDHYREVAKEILTLKDDWIPVTEKLPKEYPGSGVSEDVLILMPDDFVSVGKYDFNDNVFYDYRDGLRDDSVTHWMPQPKPPQL